MIDRSVCIAAFIWTICSFSSLADDARLTHLAHLMAEAAVGENAPELKLDLVAGALLDKLPLSFETTTLADIQTLSRGTGHAVDEANGKLTWLCYTRPANSAKALPENGVVHFQRPGTTRGAQYDRRFPASALLPP